MAINTISGSSISTGFQFNATNNQTGSAYTGINTSGNLRKTYSVGTGSANAASGGGDEVFSFQQTIAGGGSATIDLNALTNVLNQTSVAIVRIKGYQIRLLNATDDSTITTPVATAVTVTNIGPTLPSPLDFQNGGSGLTLALTTSGGAVTAVAIGAAGTGYPPSTLFLVSPVQASGSGCVVAVKTNSSGVPTSTVFITGAGGAGYSDATVPSIVAGQYEILSGGAHCYFDVSAGGFLAVSATQRNIKIYNMDGTNTATCEVDVFGATS